jgi:hypothetical protein
MEESMLEEIVRHYEEEIKGKAAEWISRLKGDWTYEDVEGEVLSWSRALCTGILGVLLEEVLGDKEVLGVVRRLGGQLGYRLVNYSEVEVRLGSGGKVRVRSPYFVKASPKRGRKKPGPNGRGCHLLLELLGFVGRCSSGFVSEVVKMALLCPSLEVAREVLSGRGILIDEKALRRLCGLLGEVGVLHRGESSLEEGEDVSGKTVVVGIDGGRLRTRRKKRGRRRKGLKRTGFSTPWREPKLFTIYVLDAQGRVDKTFRPVHDATLEDADGVFRLLATYLQQLRIQEAARVIFVGDGADWIWNRVSPLVRELSLGCVEVFEVVDYFHAASHLWGLVELRGDLSTKERKRLYKQWKRLLWEGDVEGLKHEVTRGTRGKGRKELLEALTYFQTHAARMQYAQFKARGIPQGSGCVESAMRRVINLRLKAPGTFWTPSMAEYFLFLRSCLICGRWTIFLHHVAARRRPQVSVVRGTGSSSVSTSQNEESNFRYPKTGTYDI